MLQMQAGKQGRAGKDTQGQNLVRKSHTGHTVSRAHPGALQLQLWVTMPRPGRQQTAGIPRTGVRLEKWGTQS